MIQFQSGRLFSKLKKIIFLPFLIIILLLLSPTPKAHAQLDVVHYFPPFYATWTPNLAARLYLSTPSVSSVNVSVDDGAGTNIWSGTISNASPTWVNVSSNVLTADAQLNTVQTNGLVITADDQIYANIRHTVDAQASSATAKGQAALGTSFRAGVVRDSVTPINQSYRGVFIAVMSTEDNTTVNFDDIKPGVVFYNTPTSGSPSTSDPISVNLDANESYVIGIRATTYAGSASFTDVNGTHVTSDKPIVVNSGSWLAAPGSSQDIGLDQIIPDSRLTGEYILMQGNGGNGVQETPIVVATIDGTDVTVNGDPTIRCSLNAGDYCFLDGLYSVGGNMLVQATAPVYIYQTMAGASGNNQTIGMNFIPPVDITSPNFVDNIPDVTYTGNATVNILARSGASVDINGSPVGVVPSAVPGTADWVTYRVTGLSGNIGVTSSEAIAVQFINVSPGIGAAGYYSGLPLVYRDYGDLPASYNLTTSTDNGASHVSSSLFLGATIDGETDGQPSADAGRSFTDGDDGNDTNDEDGIGVFGTWREGANGGTVDIIVAGGNGCVSGWIDWDSNSSFGDTGEQVLDMAPVSEGTNRVSFTIPAGVLPSQDIYDVFSRFRLSADTGIIGDCSDDTALALTGLVGGGEVEDHYLRFSRPTGTGPGGVALNDGSTSLELWLMANAGAYSDNGTTLATNGQGVQQWQDQSGNANHVAQAAAGSRPTFQDTSAFNAMPMLDFSSDFLDRQPNVMPSAGSDGSVYFVGSNGTLVGWDTAVGFDNNTADGDLPLFGTFNNQQSSFMPTNNNPSALSTSTAYILGWTWVTNTAFDFHINGATWNAGNPITGLGTNVVKVGGETQEGEYWDGPATEVIIYSTHLNDARQTIVENYLQGKYNDSTSDNLTIANDVYDGDTTANGNFDMDIAGIGLEADGDNWTAHSAGIIVQDVSFLNDTGDYLLYGHNVADNGNTTDNIPDTGDWDGINDQRWLRHWYFDRTDAGATGGLVDIFFDFSEADMIGSPAGSADNYRFLRRANPTGQFEDITSLCTGSTSIIDDQVIFREVDVTCLGSNFTLGTIDTIESPTSILMGQTTANGSTDWMPFLLVGVLLLLLMTGLVLNRRRLLR